MSTWGRPEVAPLVHHLGQAVQGLGTEDEIHVGCPLHDGGALLAGDTAAHADDQVGILLLEVAHHAQIGEHLFLGLFPHRTGVEQDDVGLLGLVGLLEALADRQHVGHLVRVVLVHLATKGADEDFAGHSCGGRRGEKKVVVMGRIELPTCGL
jgi:hypothetical protein